MSQRAPPKCHVTKYGMYSKSNNRLIFCLKPYRNEASMRGSLLWFVRCRRRERERQDTKHETVKHVYLISDAEPQGSQQGKKTL